MNEPNFIEDPVIEETPGKGFDDEPVMQDYSGRSSFMRGSDPKSIVNDNDLKELLAKHQAVIKVVGCGGAGNNTINRLSEVGIVGVEAIAINTDAQDLLYTTADKKIKGLVGLYFLSFDEDKKLNWQGVVRGMIGEYILVDSFSWLTGDYWCSNLVPISQCCAERWNFYYSEEDWREEAKRKSEIEKIK